MSAHQAKMVRDSRGMPEFIYNPRRGEILQEAFDIKSNPSLKRDWYKTKFPICKESYNMTVAHWALTEARFRKHIKEVKASETKELIHLDNMLTLVIQQDVIYRRVFNENSHAFIPDWGVYFKAEIE